MDELLNLQYDCFPTEICEVFMGCHSRADLGWVKENYVGKMLKDPNDVWVKVVDNDTGRMIAGSNWKLYANGKSDGGVKDEVPAALEGEAREKSQKIIDMMNEKRAQAMPGPFIRRLSVLKETRDVAARLTRSLDLHICFTHSGYRRQGAGGLMMQWGCDVADLLGLPGWIEASDEGNFLYKTFGFYEYEKIQSELGGTNMKRDARTFALAGGKASAGKD